MARPGGRRRGRGRPGRDRSARRGRAARKVRSAQSYDDSITPTFARPLARLEVLESSNVAFRRVALTPETTPALRELRRQNVPEDCEICVRCPELRKVAIRYYPGDEAGSRRCSTTRPSCAPSSSRTSPAGATAPLAGPSVGAHRPPPDRLSRCALPSGRRDAVTWARGNVLLEVPEFPETHPVAVKRERPREPRAHALRRQHDEPVPRRGGSKNARERHRAPAYRAGRAHTRAADGGHVRQRCSMRLD